MYPQPNGDGNLRRSFFMPSTKIRAKLKNLLEKFKDIKNQAE